MRDVAYIDIRFVRYFSLARFSVGDKLSKSLLNHLPTIGRCFYTEIRRTYTYGGNRFFPKELFFSSLSVLLQSRQSVYIGARTALAFRSPGHFADIGAPALEGVKQCARTGPPSLWRRPRNSKSRISASREKNLVCQHIRLGTRAKYLLMNCISHRFSKFFFMYD